MATRGLFTLEKSTMSNFGVRLLEYSNADSKDKFRWMFTHAGIVHFHSYWAIHFPRQVILTLTFKGSSQIFIVQRSMRSGQDGRDMMCEKLDKLLI